MTPDGLPAWWQPLLSRALASRTEDFTRLAAPARGGRASAVLVLLGEQEPGPGGPGGPDVLMLQRAATMRTHAGQPAFPGGAADPGDVDAAATALREAQEEVGLDPASATVVAQLPELWIPVSDFLVTPVLAWWHRPHEVHPCQPAEVARVARLPIAELVDPANRLQVRHTSGWVGPAFQLRGMLVWGFTAAVLSALLDMAGWARPWQRNRVAEAPRGGGVPVLPDPVPPDLVLPDPVPPAVARPGGTGDQLPAGATPVGFAPRPGRPARSPLNDEVNR